MPPTADILEEPTAEVPADEPILDPEKPIPFGPTVMAMLADASWIDARYNDGSFDEFTGEFVAVVDKTLLGHGPKVKELREDVSRATGIPVARIVTTFIDRNMYW